MDFGVLFDLLLEAFSNDFHAFGGCCLKAWFQLPFHLNLDHISEAKIIDFHGRGHRNRVSEGTRNKHENDTKMTPESTRKCSPKRKETLPKPGSKTAL